MIKYTIGDISLTVKGEFTADEILNFVKNNYEELKKYDDYIISKGDISSPIKTTPPERKCKEKDIRNYPIWNVLPIVIKAKINDYDLKVINNWLNLEDKQYEPDDKSIEVYLKSNKHLFEAYKQLAMCAFNKQSNHKFSTKSLTALESCNSLLASIFYIVGIYENVTILEGHRTEELQNKYYEEGVSQLRFPHSKHNAYPSKAVDVVPYPIDWKDEGRLKLFIGKVKMLSTFILQGKPLSLITGIDWDNDTKVSDHSFLDHPHFELRYDSTKQI